MESILTQCPRCQTSFKVSDKQLAIAEGYVRCGSCLDVFSAIANRITIKQPASTEDFPEDLDDADEESSGQPIEDNNSTDIEVTKTITSTPEGAAVPAAFDLSHSVTLKYPVGQLIDADDVVPVNVITDTRPSSFTSDSGFVFDDDIPLGDMVLDDDLDAGDEVEDDHDEEPEAADAFEDSETIVLELDEEFTSAESVSGFTDDASADEQLNPETTTAVEAHAIAVEAPVIAVEAQATTEADAGATQASSQVDNPQFEPEPAFSPALGQDHAEQASPVAPSTDKDAIAEAAQEFLQQPLDNPDTHAFAAKEEATVVERGADEITFAQKQAVIDPEADALFHRIYDSTPLDDAKPVPASDAPGETTDTAANQETLYEAYAASIPAEAGAEEPQEIMAQGFAANQDDAGNLDTEEAFTANDFSSADELGVDGFRTLAVNAAEETEELADLPRKTPSRHEKEELRQYLADLEDADALEPLPATTMDAIEAEPLTLEVRHAFRKYMNTFGWFCLSLALVAVFVFQVVAANLELMQQSPAYSRYLPLFCRVLDCPAPASLAAGIQSLSSQDLLVRSHPRIPDALEVSFIFRNDADLPQPFPLVELSFRDSNRQLIANRLFTPEEYLPPELAALAMMPGRTSVQVMLELVDPGSEAVDYEIIFRDATQQSLNNSARPADAP